MEKQQLCDADKCSKTQLLYDASSGTHLAFLAWLHRLEVDYKNRSKQSRSLHKVYTEGRVLWPSEAAFSVRFRHVEASG
jgi:hypothetical protein